MCRFLHALLTDTVYVEWPPGNDTFKGDYVYVLNKAMYGLKASPRAYTDHFSKILSGLGFEQSIEDDCLFTYRKDNRFIHYLFHVDDICVVSNDPLLERNWDN